MATRSTLLWLAALVAACGGAPNPNEPACGDGVVSPGEQCDDGNTASGDGCSADCQNEGPGPRCGDGFVDAGEECDDADEIDTDGCVDCRNAFCGDGFVQDNVEECDDGNTASGDGCFGCQVEVAGVCGDGVINTGEECDDGNFLPGDACMPICENPPKEDTFLFSEVDNLFDTAEYCEAMVNRHAVARAVDLEDGGLRWRCGDVTGIDPSQYGQEYCEYFAFANGGRVDTAAGLSLAEPSYCVFTAVFSDKTSRGPALAAALAAPENLGSPVNVDLVVMQRGVNSSGAADGLIGQCSTMGGSNNEVRQTACYEAFARARAAGDTATADELRVICRGQNLADDARFAQAEALGAVVPVEGDPGFEQHRNIRACVATSRGGGAFFRNSDTQICGRTFRANNECTCSYNQLPTNLDGFLFSIWFTPENDRIPPECRLAKVNGQDYPHLMLCEIPTQEIPEIQADPVYSQDMQGFCNDRFGKNLGLFAPLSALEVAGSCDTTTAFCQDFTD